MPGAGLTYFTQHIRLFATIYLYLEWLKGLFDLDDRNVHTVLSGKFERDHYDLRLFDLNLKVCAITMWVTSADYNFLELV